MVLGPAEWTAIGLSMKVAAVSTLIGAVPAMALAWLLARRSFPGKTLLDTVVHLPLVLPPVAVGYVLLLSLGRRSAVGGWLLEHLGVRLAFTWYGAVVAAMVMSFPLVVRGMRLAIELVDPRLEQAARTLGASPARVFLTVTLPLALRGVLAGLVLGFVRSLGEFGATITFAGNTAGQTRTLSLALYTSSQSPGDEASAMRIVVVCVALCLVAVLASEFLSRRITTNRG